MRPLPETPATLGDTIQDVLAGLAVTLFGLAVVLWCGGLVW